MRTLTASYVQSRIFILKDAGSLSVTFNPENETVVKLDNGMYIRPSCINCIEPRCMKMDDTDMGCAEFPEIAQNMNRDVCPVNAIKTGLEKIEIDDNKCIGCGLCAASCPFGAIYLKSGKAKVSIGDRTNLEELLVNADGIKRQCDYIKHIAMSTKTGTMQQESDHVIDAIYENIKNMSQEEQNILARNLLVRLGNHATLGRQGNVYMRMDGLYKNKMQFGIVEIETGMDVLDVARAILDDIAVMNVRYGVDKSKNHPLAIILGIPNKRTDYWQVIKDIKNIVDIPISTITFGALLILLWNNRKENDFDKYYIDIDNSSIRKPISALAGRSIKLSEGFCGVLENEK